jgi:alpha-beta hydrolase superfamily lysophospholipase
MILNSTTIEQTVDRDERARFLKDLVVVRAKTDDDPEGAPLAMIRKRLAPSQRGPLSQARHEPVGSAGPTRTLAPVILLHGYGQNRYAWHLPSRSLFNYLARSGYDVFNLELRGHGRSRHLGAHPPKRVSDFVEHDVPAAIDEVQRLSGGRPVFLVGHSLGGLISYASAAKLRERIAGVVTLGSPYQFTRGSLTLTALSTMLSALDRRVSLSSLPPSLAAGVELRVLSEAMRLFRVFIESPIFPLPIRGFAPKSLEPNILSQHMALAMDTGSVAVLRSMFLDAAERRRGGKCLGDLTEYAEAFEGLATPLLVIAGTKDDLAPPESVEPAFLRSRSPDKTYRAFPRGHIDLLAGRDAPQTIWPLIQSWLHTRVRRMDAAKAA